MNSLLLYDARAEANLIAAEIKARWRSGETPDLSSCLFANPALLRYKSIVIELAYEEFCLLEERGEKQELHKFCQRMPAFATSIRKVLDAHTMLSQLPAVDPSVLAWPNPGDQINGLDIGHEIARGSFARVYHAFDSATDRHCVLKLSPCPAEEGRALGPLTHPHIIDVYWAKRIAGLEAICMPLVGVVTLEDALELALPQKCTGNIDPVLDAIETAIPSPPPVPSRSRVAFAGESYALGIAAIGSRIASALDYLHSLGREHGDIKPTNILLGSGGYPFLIDFNLSIKSGVTESIGGTLAFMAPERLEAFSLRKKPPSDSGQADIFSLGAMLYQQFTGRLPWNVPSANLPLEQTAEILLRNNHSESWQWPDSSSLPKSIRLLIGRCLSCEPIKRPCAAEVASQLSAWVDSSRRSVPRSRVRAYIAPSIVAILLFGSITHWANRLDRSDEQGRQPVEAPGPNPELQSSEDFFQSGLDRLRNSPLKDEDIQAALLDFDQANSLNHNAKNLAYSAYCMTLLSRTQGIERNREAIAAGANSAEIHNNLGVLNLERNNLQEALKCFDVAIRMDPSLPAARLNRAKTYMRFKLNALGQLPDLQCITDFQFVLEAGTATPDVYYQAARAFLASEHLGNNFRERALDLLVSAVELGWNPKKFSRDQLLVAAFRDEPRFKRFETMDPKVTRSSTNYPRVTEPRVQ